MKRRYIFFSRKESLCPVIANDIRAQKDYLCYFL